jgi:pyrrolidone-carboxylate peptidase
MEARFSMDFGRVRIHDDAHAAESTRAVDAHAYAVGPHIAFGTGRYSPHDAAGLDLLVHELAHVALDPAAPAPVPHDLRVEAAASPTESRAEGLARRVSAGRGVVDGGPPVPRRLRRKWDQPRSTDCSDVAEDRWLKKVVVEQESSQFVTLHWSDGSLETAGCSTGKGHCCSDTSDGVVCDRSRSRTTGSNCTPITNGAEYSITDRHLQHNGWNYWNTFVPGRGIALHEYPVVDGTPLSHGCVRLPIDTARHIFCGARQNATKVEVRGYARPDCKHPQLKEEWRKDIGNATLPGSDGEEYRTIVRDGYGRDLNDEDRADLLGNSPTLPLPPRCLANRTAPVPTDEEKTGLPVPTSKPQSVPDPAVERGLSKPEERSGRAIVPGDVAPSMPQQILESSGFEATIPAFIKALSRSSSLTSARTVVRAQGQALWEKARKRAQSGSADTDDRPLYWSRLEMTRALRSFQPEPRWKLSAADRDDLVSRFEQASRGMDTAGFTGAPAKAKRILISGFDPFGDTAAGRSKPFRGAAAGESNPSGAAALALDGRTLTAGGVSARIEAVIFPVRFADFDAGVIEKFLQPYLDGTTRVDMVMTVSMGGGTEFEVEQFAGRQRTSRSTDNLGATGGGTPVGGASGVATPPGLAAGPQFLETTLPSGVRSSLRSSPLPQETEITEIPKKGGQPVRRTTGGPTPDSTAIEGSGSNFLSNEIFYRTRLLRDASGSAVPMGHLHTPFLDPLSAANPSAFASARDTIVARIEKILTDTLPTL